MDGNGRTGTPCPGQAPRRARGWRAWTIVAIACASLAGAAAWPQEAATPGAAELLARRQSLLPALRAGLDGEPVVLSSRERRDLLEGDVHAEVPFGLAVLAERLRSPEGLCAMLLLHLNVRGCQPVRGTEGVSLSVVMGPKRQGGVGARHVSVYAMQVQTDAATHFRVALQADHGPMSIRDVRMVLQAVPLDPARSFVHVGYAYRVGTLGRLALSAYLATAGRQKTGFTVVGTDSRGQPVRIDGPRAALERNVMRYYLAILAVAASPPESTPQAWQARLRTWFALTERHAEQLHEYGLEEYLENKRADLAFLVGR